MRQAPTRTGSRRRDRRREQGVALIAAMMILALVVTLAITAMETTARDQQVAGVQARSRVALQAAEAGLAQTLATVGTGTPVLVAAAYGDGSIHKGGQPSYQLDPNVADPVESLGSIPVPEMSLNINGNGPKFQLQLWRISVQGSEPSGMTARVEAGTAELWGK
jgi:hypothetical protein